MLHISGRRAGKHDAVGVARRGDKLDAEPAHVEVHIGESVQFELAAVAAAS
jgi:hypothetical protein